MKSLRSKASHFFRDGPSQDEKAANADSGSDADFDAGIQGRNMRKKSSRFFLRKNHKLDKSLPPRPSNASSSTLVALLSADVKHGGQDGEVASSENALSFPPAPHDFSESPESMGTVDSADGLKLKPRPSLATLRSKSSRLFRDSKSATHSPPAPPMPQIPVDPPGPKSHRPVLTPLHSACDSRSSTPNLQGRSISISRPALIAQLSSSAISEYQITVPFTKPAGPPPLRPPRPNSLDEETLAFMQEGGTRMCLPTSNRVSASTATCSTPRSQASSIEARLGFPSGHGTPRSYSIDSPLAARFPFDPLQPLPVRDSTGSSKSYSRFSEYIKAQQNGYAIDGVDAEDRETGPIEQYRDTDEGDWTLEKRISKGPHGNPGMLFRDTWGGFHFVADI